MIESTLTVVCGVGSKGRGVRATKMIPTGTLFAWGAVIIVSFAEDDPLDSYTFEWGNLHAVLSFGPATFVNHSATPNVKYARDFERKLLGLQALTDIQAGDELEADYGVPLWFEPAPEEKKA